MFPSFKFIALIIALGVSSHSFSAEPNKGDGMVQIPAKIQKLLESNPDIKSLLGGSNESDSHNIIKKMPDALHALPSDPRVSFSLYTPDGFWNNPKDYKLLAVIHDSNRNVFEYRDSFKEFADKNKFVVLAPLFPVGINGDSFADGYKNIVEGKDRYDLKLLSMVSSLEESCNCSFEKFYLYGFSGGGQFAHRFYYLHPEKLAAISIGAPGLATKIDAQRPWFFGTGDFQKKFNQSINIEQMRKVPVQILVGDKDTEEFNIPDKYKDLANQLLGKYGKTRVENMKILSENYQQHGINNELKIVHGYAHEGVKLAPYAAEFFLDTIKLQK